MAINTGVNVTKTNAYPVLSVQTGVDATKASAYSVLGVQVGVSVSKANAYAVTIALPNVRNPVIFVCT